MNMDNKNKVLELSIFNKVYSITTDENETDVVAAAEMLDKILKDISNKTKINNEGKLAILAALQIAFDLKKQQNIEQSTNTKLSNVLSVLDTALSTPGI